MSDATPEDAAAAAPVDTPSEPKETKSFEERLAELKKPDPVPNPDQDKVNDKLSRLNAQIGQCDKRLSEIKAALDKANSERDRSKDATKGIVEQLKALRVRMQTASRDKEACFQALRDMTQARQAQQKSLQDMRRSLKFQDVGEVEQRVRELEAQIEQGQCKNMKEEKSVLQEIKQLNQMKRTIDQYQSQRSTVIDDSENKASLEARKAACVAEIDVCKKECEVLEKELDAKRAKTTEGAPNVNELWKEQKELYGQIKTHRAEIRQVNGAFKEEVNKWRDYQRVLNGYKKAQGKILAEQRKAEWEARKLAEGEPVDKDVPTDDPFVGHPFADEIYQCTDLEKCLAVYLPKEAAKEEAAKEEGEKAWLKGAGGKNAVKEEDDGMMFSSCVVKKKKKGSNKGGEAPKPKDTKVMLSVDMIGALTAIGVTIPTSTEQVAGCIEQVKAKKDAFQGMSEEDKKKFKKDRSQAKHKAVEGATGGSLVAIDITATGSNIKVKLEYPALAA